MNKNIENIKKRKVAFIIILIFLMLFCFIILIVHYEMQKKEEKFNKNLKELCIETIEKEDFSDFKKYVSTIEKNEKKEKAYNELKSKLKEEADLNINNYEKSNSMLTAIKKEIVNGNDIKLNSILSFAQALYTYNVCLINGNKAIEDGRYYSAYCVYENGKKTIIYIDANKAKAIEEKQQDIYDKSKEDAKSFLISKIASPEVDKYIPQSQVKAYIDIVKEEDLIKLYNEWNEKNEIKKKEERDEKKAKEKEAKKKQGVRIGMSKQDVLDSSWGEPTKINKSTYSWGTTEQWVYPNYNYLYFENGKLTSIQTNE